jgi:hypothetical protein
MTVSEAPTPLTLEEKGVIKQTLLDCIGKVPAYLFTGLQTKARVTVASTASWENTRREGGTVESIRNIILDWNSGMEAEVINLNTGTVESHLKKGECEPGTYIFWRCLGEVLRTDPEELGKVFLTVVTEPGKGRSITKGAACLKIVLDTISRIVSYPLTKGFESSTSGMERANQGWQFFKAMHSQSFEEIVFNVNHRNREETFEGTTINETLIYSPAYASSTDYSEATDYMHPEVARILSNGWMLKCGIPPVLRGIVNRICYKPRWVYFKADEALKDIGDPVGSDNITRRIRLRRGVLMGDPLTKIVLHLTNISVRELANNFTTKCWLESLIAA